MKRSLTWRIGGFVLLQMLLFGVSLFLIADIGFSQNYWPAIEANRQQLATQVAGMESRRLRTALQSLNAMARDLSVTSPEGIAALLSTDRHASPVFNGLAFFDIRGRMAAISPAAPALIGHSFRFRRYVSEVLAGRPFYASSPLEARTHRIVLVLAVPVRTGTRTIGVLSGAIHLSRPRNDLQVATRFRQSGAIYVLDPSGRILESPSGTGIGQRLRGIRSPGSVFLFQRGGAAYLGSRAVVLPVGWSVLVEQKVSELTAPFRTLALSLGGVFLLLAFLSILLWAWLTGRLLVRPILELRYSARALANGDFSHRVPTGAIDELGELGAAFNGMAERIAEGIARQERTLMDTVSLLGRAVEAKDRYTEEHSQRVGELAVRIALEMGLRGGLLRTIRIGAILHDVGKLGVPEDVLRKEGELTEEEWQRIREHPAIGGRILAGVEGMEEAAAMVAQHHEHLDGSGYPAGLAADGIRLEARIVAVADAYDAMTSDRAYRSAIPPQEAMIRIRERSGTWYDPRVVEALRRALGNTAEG